MSQLDTQQHRSTSIPTPPPPGGRPPRRRRRWPLTCILIAILLAAGKSIVAQFGQGLPAHSIPLVTYIKHGIAAIVPWMVPVGSGLGALGILGYVLPLLFRLRRVRGTRLAAVVVASLR